MEGWWGGGVRVSEGVVGLGWVGECVNEWKTAAALECGWAAQNCP